ncbi:AmmeMemoRadiSam system radical SAM enzyme [Candidatus Nitrososphaera sp. FF02]|uniref:AmmeMemoRadiSam system radical SAM enzyme n=1 Tax=Candidatus Nitrososphaera sp. FF02 TaxID=3398226 RepID=UPI0039EAB573
MQSEAPGRDAELGIALPNGRVKCTACARYCEIPEGKAGLCGVRGVVNDRLRLFVYGRVITGHVDPIEKKPVTHYNPGSSIYSIATTGCNWLCQYCQNYDISQRRKVEGVEMTPAQVAQEAQRQGAHGIAYTYNEPSIFIEFARDCGIEAHKRGLFNIFVSNGYDTPESVREMGKFLDCITVDFKGSGKQEFVRRYIGIPSADPIFNTLLEIKSKTKIHVEITDLIVPEVGDDLESAKKLCRFVHDELGPDTLIHFLRFHPDYKMMQFGPTPVATLEKHCKIATDAGLRYAYVGNVPGHPLEDTYCPGCKNVAIGRYGYLIDAWNLDEQNKCKTCGYQLPVTGKLHAQKKNYFQFI